MLTSQVTQGRPPRESHHRYQPGLRREMRVIKRRGVLRQTG
jgi:hypothetical protein